MATTSIGLTLAVVASLSCGALGAFPGRALDPSALLESLSDFTGPDEAPPLDFLVPPEIWSFPDLSSADNSLKSLPSLLPHFNSSCSCERRKCSCCTQMEVTRLRKNHTSCVSLTYVRERLAVTLKASLNNFTVLEKDLFSGSNPPPFCFPIPQLPFLTVCVRLANVSLTDDARLQGCASVEAGVVLIPPLVRFRFGCLLLGPGGASWSSQPVSTNPDSNTQAQAAIQQLAAALNSTEKEQFLLLQSILRHQTFPTDKQRKLWP